ncbi:MAG: hypothetical protein ACFFE2_13920 [Candidatus Thorarchaeota archaeon]
MSLLFQNAFFVLYVLVIWIYVGVTTTLLTPRVRLYFEQQLDDPVVISARTSQLVSTTVCGFGTVIVILLLAPFFITFFGVPDWFEFLVAFSGATIIEVSVYSRKSRRWDYNTWM